MLFRNLQIGGMKGIEGNFFDPDNSKPTLTYDGPLVKLKTFGRGTPGYYQITIPKHWVDDNLRQDQGVDLFQVPGSVDLVVRPATGDNDTTHSSNQATKGRGVNGQDVRHSEQE